MSRRVCSIGGAPRLTFFLRMSPASAPGAPAGTGALATGCGGATGAGAFSGFFEVTGAFAPLLSLVEGFDFGVVDGRFAPPADFFASLDGRLPEVFAFGFEPAVRDLLDVDPLVPLPLVMEFSDNYNRFRHKLSGHA
jgi:hypothetical protein